MDEQLQLKTLEEGTRPVGEYHKHHMEQGMSPMIQVTLGQVCHTFRRSASSTRNLFRLSHLHVVCYVHRLCKSVLHITPTVSDSY